MNCGVTLNHSNINSYCFLFVQSDLEIFCMKKNFCLFYDC